MRQNILEKHPAAELKVYAVWFSMLPSDSREGWDASLLDDRRVSHFWDENRRVGTWLAERERSGLDYGGPIVWDAYLAFGPNARWGDKLSGLAGSGWPVIGATGQLERDLAPLLELE